MMKSFHKLAIAGLLACGAIIAATTPAMAHVDVSIAVGAPLPPPPPPPPPLPPPAFVGDYDFYRPCTWYRYWEIPAPARCYRAYWGFYGRQVYIVDGFVFRDHEDWDRWHDRDEWRHWRAHEFRRADWQEHDWHDHGWHGRGHAHDDGDDDDQGEDHDRD
jgi:hypothetical protein